MPSENTILDPASDANLEELARLAKLYDFPAYVKQADIDFTTNPTNIGVNAYADPLRKKFACHTKAATWLSGLYFNEKKAEYHPKDRKRVAARLEKFSDYFGIRSAYDAVEKQASELNSQQLPDSSYAYVWVDDQGNKDRHLPLDSAMNVKAAAEWLGKYRDHLPFSDRSVIANKILEKAASFSTALPSESVDMLEKQAGHGVPDPSEISKMIEQRASLAPRQAQRDEILKLAAAVRSTPKVALEKQSLIKLASTIDDIDNKMLNLRGNYTDVIQRPEDVIFKVTFTKAASEQAELCTLQTGKVYKNTQLSKLAREDVESVFGSDFANEVCTGLDIDPVKMAEVAHTLPTPDAELLEHLLSEVGQGPQFAKQANDSMPEDTLQALAALYS